MSKNIQKLAKLTKNEEFVKNFEENLHGFSNNKNKLARRFTDRISNQMLPILRDLFIRKYIIFINLTFDIC